MFSLFRKKPAADAPGATDASRSAPSADPAATPEESPAQRRGWVERLRGGLRKTGRTVTQVFSTARIDDALYDELEAAMLMADAGPGATHHLLDDLKRRVRERNARDPAAVKALLEDALAD